MNAARGAGEPDRAFPAAFRIVILSSVLLLAVYTMLTLYRLNRAGPVSASAPQVSAEMLAVRAQAALQRLRISEQAAAGLLGQPGGEPLDAAEQALRLAQPDAAGAAVVSGQQVVAATGGAADAAWKAAAAEAARSGKAVWLGAPAAPLQGRGRWTYVATAVNTPAGRAYLILAADLDALTASDTGQVRLLASADGVILAGSGLGPQIGVLADLGLDPAQARPVDETAGDGQAPPGPGAHFATALSPDRSIIAAAAAPFGAAARAARRTLAFNIFSLIAPLLIGCALMLMLMLQTRRAEAAQQAQSESERRFRLAVEAARCGIWEWRLREQTVSMSDVTGVMLGWGGGGFASSEDVIARIAPEHRDRVRQALSSASSFGAFDVTFCVPRPTGGMAWIDARGQAFGEPDAKGFATLIGVALDVTEERTAEHRAQAAERRLRDAIESVSEAFVLWDKRGRLLMYNANFRDFFSIEPRVLKLGAERAMVDKVCDLAVKRATPAANGRRDMRELEMVDGRWLQVSERRTADGAHVVTAADITAVKRQEEARRLNEEALEHVVERLEESRAELTELAEKYQAEKIKAEGANTAKSEFLANMSHELRTPLNAVNGFSDMMVNEMFGPLGDKRYKEYAQDILASGQHLLALINDILDMSKIEAGKMALTFDWMEIGEVVEDAVRLMRNRAESANLTLACSVAPGLPEIEADYRSIKQVLLNLLSNAVKFTPAGGRVEVKAWAIGEETSSPSLRIAVSDTGIGIAKADIGRLGRPFEQIETQHSKTQQGTGLGLALTKSLIEMHGGVFELESDPGQGVTASFTLPVHRARKSKPTPARVMA